MMKKSIKAGLVSTTLAASLLLSTTGVFAFSDVDSNHWAANDIAKLSNAGYINGYEDGTFAPSAFITRAEFVTIINKVKGASARSYKTFPDVSSDAWYADQIDIAATAGFITGYDDGSIRPDACISRAEVAVVCYKAWGLTPEGQLSFTDKDQIGSWAQSQIATLVAKNVLSGYEDGSFRPNDAVTRAEVAKIVSRLIDMKDGTVATTTKPGVTTPAGLSNTSVVVKNGSSSSGGGGGSSSTSNSNPSTTQKKALTAFVDNDVDDDDYYNTLKTVLGYSGVASTNDVKKVYTELYKDAISALIDEMNSEYDDLDLSKKKDAKVLANDMGAVVLAVNDSVEQVKKLCKAGDLNLDSLLDYAEDLEDTIKDKASNGSDVYDIVVDFCTDLYNRLSKNLDKINGKNLTNNDIIDIYNGDYDFDAADKPAPSSTEKEALNNVIKNPEKITTNDLGTIIEYSEVKAEVKKELSSVYQDAVSELISTKIYESTDTATGSDATKLANDTATIVLATNEAVDKVVELAKAGNLNSDSLVEYRSELNKIIEENATTGNAAEVKEAVNEFSIELYAKLKDKISEINGNEELTVEKLLEFYNENK